ncbi:uncharacterized protein LOC119097501 [Pollicipes pollicipes]|uniref:uncharacterized protein LOC119097501 n=1 Tax=Pollicipes pollicipes TaxID=41117 RepID=UPI001884B682|nr:uncharacterized protein LOC119097501 [Pollicipes pollicipes]
MGLFEGRSRVKRATTAPHSNLSLEVFISNNKLGKRVSKSCMEPPEPDGELADRRLRLSALPPPAARTLRQRPPPPPGDEPDSPAPLHNGCNGHGPEPARKRLTEAQKLMLSSECHKTEIFATKLRHIPGRLGGGDGPPAPLLAPHRNGERPRRRRRSEAASWEEPAPAAPARKRVALDSLLLRDNHEYYKVEILSSKLRSSRRLSGDSDVGPPRPEADESIFCAADEVGPEDSCDSFRVVRRGASLAYTFESSPGAEQWYQTYARETDGQPVVEALAAAVAASGPVLPYQMSSPARLLAQSRVLPGGPAPPLSCFPSSV